MKHNIKGFSRCTLVQARGLRLFFLPSRERKRGGVHVLGLGVHICHNKVFSSDEISTSKSPVTYLLLLTTYRLFTITSTTTTTTYLLILAYNTILLTQPLVSRSQKHQYFRGSPVSLTKTASTVLMLVTPLLWDHTSHVGIAY